MSYLLTVTVVNFADLDWLLNPFVLFLYVTFPGLLMEFLCQPLPLLSDDVAIPTVLLLVYGQYGFYAGLLYKTMRKKYSRRKASVLLIIVLSILCTGITLMNVYTLLNTQEGQLRNNTRHLLYTLYITSL